MCQAHFRSDMTVTDRASFPCCSEFRHSHCKERLRDSVCACGYGLGWYPPACGLRQSSLIRQFAPKRVVHFGGSGCCRSHGHESQFFRLKEDCGEKRRVACSVREEKFGGPSRLDYGLEIHRWVQEALSLLVRFNTGLFPGRGKWGDVRCGDTPFLRCDRELDVDSESRFSFKHWVCEEFTDGDVGRAPEDKSTVGGRRNRASRGGHRRRYEPEDDDADYEVSAPCTDYDSSSSSTSYSCSKGRHNRGRLQVKFAVHDKHFSSRLDQTESTSRASDRHVVRTDTRHRSSHGGRHYKRKDDDAGYDVSARWTDYDSSSSSSYSSSNRRQTIGSSQVKVAVHDGDLSSRRDQTESRARDRHGVTKHVACEAESSFTSRSVGTQTRRREQILREYGHSSDWNRRNKQQETDGGDQSFSKRDEIKVCVGEEENPAALSRTADRHREQEILMKQEDSQIARRNIARHSSVSGASYSGGYRPDKSWKVGHDESYEDGQVRIGVTRELNQRCDRTAHDCMESSVTGTHYRYKDEQRVLLNERQETSTAVQRSAQHSKQAQVNESSRKPAPPHPDSSVTVVDSDLSRLHESEYVCKHCGSCIVESLRQVNTNRMDRDTRIKQEWMSSTQVANTSSPQLPPQSHSSSSGQEMTGYTTSDYVGKHRVEYMREGVTGGTPMGVRIAEPVTLQQEQRSQPSEPRPGSSSRFADAHLSDRLAISVFVTEGSRSLSTISSPEETIPSGRISVQGVSIHPPLSETYSDDQSPGYPTNDYVPVHHHSDKVDYWEEANTSSQTGAAIRGQVTLQNPSVPSSSKLVLQGSLTGSAAADHQPVGYTASEHVGKHHQSSNMEYMHKIVTGSTSTGARIPKPMAFLHQDQRPQPSEATPESSSKFTGAHQSDRHATSVFVAKDGHSSSTSGSQEVSLLSGQMSSQGVSIRPPPSETSGDNQSPDYAINDHVRHSVYIDYRQEFNTSSLIGTAIQGKVTLQEPSVPSSSKLVHQGSLGTAATDRQPAEYTSNESLTRSSQIGTHVLNAQPCGGTLENQAETGNTRSDDLNEKSGLQTRSSDSTSVIVLGKSSYEMKESSVQQPPAGLPSQKILKTTEKPYLVESEKTSDYTTVLPQVVLANPSSADSVKSGTSEMNSRNSGMQTSWQSPASSEIRGPPDEMWDVAGETFEEPSGMEMLEAMPLPVSVASGENLSEGTATTGAVAGADAASSKTAIVKRPSKSLWGYLAEMVKAGWILRMGSHDSTPKSTAKSSSNESGGTEAWFSGYEPDDEEKVKREKKDGSKEPPAVKGLSDEIPELSQKQGQEISDGTNVQETITNDGFATSPVGLSERGSIRRRASSLLDNQRWDSAANSTYVTSSSATASDRTSPDVITSSTGITNVQRQRESETSEMGAPFMEIPGDSQTGIRELPIKGGPGYTGKDDSETSVRQTKLIRTAQVQRETFEAWEDAYRFESQQRKTDEVFMKEALQEARKAADTWEVPVGAVLVQDGKIIARGCNLVEELRDATAHAELICIKEASKTLKSWRLSGTTLYVTLEPCAMCAGAILQARIDTLVWGAPNKLLGADGSWVRLFHTPDEGPSSSGQPSSPVGPVHPFHPNMKIRRGILETECSDVLQQFFQLRRKKTRIQESPPSCMPLADPPKFFSKMHDFFGMMICL